MQDLVCVCCDCNPHNGKYASITYIAHSLSFARTFLPLHRLSSVYGIYWDRPSQRRCMSPCARLGPVLTSFSESRTREVWACHNSPSSSLRHLHLAAIRMKLPLVARCALTS